MLTAHSPMKRRVEFYLSGDLDLGRLSLDSRYPGAVAAAKNHQEGTTRIRTASQHFIPLFLKRFAEPSHPFSACTPI